MWVTAQKLLRRLPVTIPYAGSLKFPTKPIRVRRDFQRFLTLIEGSALLHQYQREIRTVGGRQYIVATLEDYTVAFGLASVVLESSLKQLTPKAEQLAAKTAEIVVVGSDETFTRKRVVEKIGWDVKTVNKYLRELMGQGIVEETGGGKGKRSEYTLTRLPDKYHNQLLMPEELRQIMSMGDLGSEEQPRETPDGQVNLPGDLDLMAPIQTGEGGMDAKAAQQMSFLDSKQRSYPPPMKRAGWRGLINILWFSWISHPKSFSTG